MKVRRIMPALLFLFFMGAVYSNAQVTMIVNPAQGGNATEFVLEDIKTLTFGNDNLIVNDNKSNTKSFLFKDVKSIKFGGLVNDIEDISVSDVHDLNFSCVDNMLYVKGWITENITDVNIYNVNGQKAISILNWKGEPISLGSLYKGVYIIQINNRTYKITKQ